MSEVVSLVLSTRQKIKILRAGGLYISFSYFAPALLKNVCHLFKIIERLIN